MRFVYAALFCSLFLSGCPGVCGDGNISPGEICDDQDAINGDGCDGNCTVSTCGNGAIAPDGNTKTDGTRTPPEECDEGPDNSNTPNASCRADCSLPRCGDNIIDDQRGEQCDDGNTNDGDGCSASCQDESCGDGIENNSDEECDDGNTNSGDGCNGDCQDEFCGDNIENNNGETCDDGNNTPGDGCNASCREEFCGDLTINDTNETCDDGNTTPGDGCNEDCVAEFCGDNIINDTNEACDDANEVNGDGCDQNCTLSGCGNGILIEGELCLTPQQFDPGGLSFQALAVGRFDADSFNDLAVASTTGTNAFSVTIFRGNAAGGFTSSGSHTVGQGPKSLAVGRFNSDAFDDLVVANHTSSTISILLNNGSGGFGAQTTFPTGLGPRSVVVGDFNPITDSFDDIVVANSVDDTVTIFLGNGSGGFVPQTPIAVGDEPVDIAIGNLNNDSPDDFVVANQGSSNVSIFINGGFIRNMDVPANPTSILLENVAGDSLPDIVLTHQFLDTVTFIPGFGGGGFGTPVPFSGGFFPKDVTSGRFNADLFEDLAVASLDVIRVFLGDGTGNFAQPITMPSDGDTGEGFQLIVADRFNADTFDDIAVISNIGVNDSGFTVFLSDGTTCGNGFVEFLELCDDGNNNNGDGCSSICELEIAGNLIINEVDYDQPGTDASSFIEILNTTDFSIDLSDFMIVLFNGNGNVDYAQFNLSGNLAPNQYAVLASTGQVSVAPGALAINTGTTSDFIQNGPDGIGLFQLSTGQLISSLSYEGALTNVAVLGFGAGFNLVEGTATNVADNDNATGSLCRFPDGANSGNDAADWSFRTNPTPGAPNL